MPRRANPRGNNPHITRNRARSTHEADDSVPSNPSLATQEESNPFSHETGTVDPPEETPIATDNETVGIEVSIEPPGAQQASIERWRTILEKQRELEEIQREYYELKQREAQRAMAPPVPPSSYPSSWSPSWGPNRDAEPPQRVPSPGPTVVSMGATPSVAVGSRGPSSVASSGHQERVPTLPAVDPFQARDLKDWDRFRNRMLVHFNRHKGFYQDETRKVDAVAGLLDDDRTDQWLKYQEGIPQQDITWQTFTNWATSLVVDPKMIPKETSDKWYMLRQKSGQSVSDYSTQLVNLENHLARPRSTDEKIEKLRAGLFPEIKREANRFPEPEESTYNAWVNFFHWVEQQIPARQEALKKGKQNGQKQESSPEKPSQGSSKNRGHSSRSPRGRSKQPNSSSRPPRRQEESPSTGEKRKREEGVEGKMECSYCHMTNHTVESCFRKNGYPDRGTKESKK